MWPPVWFRIHQLAKTSDNVFAKFLNLMVGFSFTDNIRACKLIQSFPVVSVFRIAEFLLIVAWFNYETGSGDHIDHNWPCCLFTYTRYYFQPEQTMHAAGYKWEQTGEVQL
jgi:hypothetical protein